MSSFQYLPSDKAALLVHIWAKFGERQESLTEHTARAQAVLAELQQRYADILLRDDAFWKQIWIALLFHDTGKIAQNFQLENRKGRGKQDWNKYIRHELLSCLFLRGNYPLFSTNGDIFLAVASHHKSLDTNSLFNSDDTKQLLYEEKDIEKLEKWLQNELEKWAINWQFHPITYKFLMDGKENNLNKTVKGMQAFVKSQLCTYQSESDRQRFLEFKALLNISDWLGSAHLPLAAMLDYSPAYFAEKVKAKLLAENKMSSTASFSFFDFQERCITENNVLAIAPTGSGKTEAALLWASQKQEVGKIIYCLPTKVTSNAIFDRLVHYFGEEQLAVVHSGAKFYRLSKDEGYDEFSYLQEKSFFKNITVCTIDQLLTVGFNQGHWPIKTFFLIGGSIIIDEIHLFQPYTLGLIIASIRYMRKYCRSRFFIMSATMPSKLQSLLRKELGAAASFVEDKEKQQQARNVFKTFDGLRTDKKLQSSIIADIEAGRKVLVVVNTVDEAIATFEELSEYIAPEQSCCLHSRFTQQDRIKKEKEVVALPRETSYLLVATQVVEVSLDIDFDVLYTENAPMDAIIQRAGRVNRAGKKEHSGIVVFRATDKSRQYVYANDPVMDRTFAAIQEQEGRRITEAELVDMVDDVYLDYDVTQEESYQKALRIYQKYYEENLNYIGESKFEEKEESPYTREGLNSISVIPECFRDRLGDKTAMEKTLYQISVSRFFVPERFLSIDEDPKHPWIQYIDAPYDSRLGLRKPILFNNCEQL